MALVSMREILSDAQKKKIGIGMFNVVTMDFAQAIVEAAEEADTPVILGMPGRFFQYYPIDLMPKVCIHLAEKARVPVAVHLDHGKNYEIVMQALRAGFTSVMYDGSAEDYDTNVRVSAEIVRVAHAMGATVEGELGCVGNAQTDIVDRNSFTKPDQAADYVEKTGVDALAVAIGNLHGNYKGVPCLDLERLAEIRESVDCPLVLHGGSGLVEKDYVESIRAGISKVNIYTAMSNYVMDSLRANVGRNVPWLDLNREIRFGLKDYVREMICLFADKK